MRMRIGTVRSRPVRLPVMPPVKPMLAKAVSGFDAVPDVPGVLF